MTVRTFAMLVTSGIFTRPAAILSWSRSGPLQSISLADFRTSVATTIRVADKVQPALLMAALLFSIAFVSLAGGASSLLATIVSGLLVILIASLTVLIALQRRIVRSPALEEREVVQMRDRWLRGHPGRSIVAMASFA